MRSTIAIRGIAAGVIGLGVVVAAWGAGLISPSAASRALALATAQRTGDSVDHIVAPDNLEVKLWATGTQSLTNPDAIDVDGQHVWVAYQNKSLKDGSNNAITSTLVEYTMGGDADIVHTWAIPGHTDGLRVNPATHEVWVTSNEDASPLLEIIDPATLAVTPIALQPTAHGGGYDDIEFAGGQAFIACSNPTLNGAGVNAFPAVDAVTISGAAATVTPVLRGNAMAHDAVNGGTTQLNLTDPDSLTLDSNGNLVLVSQADSAIITIAHPGTTGQTVTKTPIGNQEDDTVWTTSGAGQLFVVDAVRNAIYTVAWKGAPGTVWTEAPNDSGVVGFVGTIDMSTGAITPVITGLVKPTGLIFVPGR